MSAGPNTRNTHGEGLRLLASWASGATDAAQTSADERRDHVVRKPGA